MPQADMVMSMEQQKPGWRAWWVVALCCFLYVFSFVDRLVLSLIVVDVGRDLRVSDTQMGLLMGSSFSIAYAVAGLPIAHMLDRANRKWIMAAGVLLWSGLTILSGFAPNYEMLLLCRAGVAVGEAVLTPGAISLFADLFPRKAITLPTALYASVASFMAVGGFILSAVALGLAHQFGGDLGLAAWRLTLILAGLPSLLLGVIFLVTVREPARVVDRNADAGAGMLDFLRHLVGQARFYIPLLVGTALVAAFLFSLVAWVPTLMSRAHGVPGQQAGYLFGIVGGGAGCLGSIFWPTMVAWLRRRTKMEPLLLMLLVGAVLTLSVGLFGPLVTHLPLFMTAIGISLFGGAAVGMLMPLIIQTYTPARMRASGMAVLMLAQSLIGYGAGPVVVALFATRWGQAPMALGFGLALLAACALPIASLSYFLARRAVFKAA